MTKRLKPHFTAKEHEGGQPFIVIEPLIEGPNLPNALYTIDLAVDTTYKRAEEIAKYLSDNIKSFGITE